MFPNHILRSIRCIQSSFTQVKRSAGHSKWANIRHTKAAKDAERNHVIRRKLNDIKIVLAGNGWVTDPVKSPTLAKAIDTAIRADIPKETIEKFLKSVQNVKEIPIDYRLRGPNESIFQISYSCPVVRESELRSQVKKLILKSSMLELTQGFQQAFEKKGVILAKLSNQEATMDDAEEAAILAGAEEVRPEEDSKQVYRYLTDAADVWQVAKALKEINWDVIEASVEDLPTYLVEIPESEIEQLMIDIDKFQQFPEFYKMVDNVA